MSYRKDLTDQEFGRLTAMSYAGMSGNDNNKRAAWNCRCTCGNRIVVPGSSLTSGHTQSCGCLRIEKLLKIHTKHGLAGTSFYKTWKNMKTRCLNPKNPAFKDYGGRGIKICSEWMKFINFKNDMYNSYLKHRKNNKSTTIERKDNNDGYCQNNCIWIAREKQSENKRPHSSMKSFLAVSPKGKRFLCNSQRLFAREHKLLQSEIGRVLSGKHKQHKKWIFNYI
jgi:hypothetical protein